MKRKNHQVSDIVEHKKRETEVEEDESWIGKKIKTKQKETEMETEMETETETETETEKETKKKTKRRTKKEIETEIEKETEEKSYKNNNCSYLYHYAFIEKEGKALKQNLLDWYYKYKRRLPWRNDDPPYCTNIQVSHIKNGNDILNYFTKKEKKKNEELLFNGKKGIPDIKVKKEKEKKREKGKEEEKGNEGENKNKKQKQKGKEKEQQQQEQQQQLQQQQQQEKETNIKKENIKKCVSERDLSLMGYRIYISEIMLQQTRVPTVLSYYLKWMEKWSSIFDLVKSDLNEVLQLWKGLGYYHRAKNLLECCKIVVNKYNGIFPNDLKLLKELPGIGTYTAKAICIHLYNMQDICVDTNIIRIFSRTTDVVNYYNSTVLNKHCDNVSAILCKDEERCSDLSQALMDLGSSLCNSSPQCSICPINANCLMYLRKTNKSDYTNSSSPFFLKHTCDCELCIAERDTLEIKNVPLVKIKKKTDKICLVLLIKKPNIDKESDECYLMKKNTDTNLFSMHYLFPCLLLKQLTKEEETKTYLKKLLKDLKLNSDFIQEKSFTFINSFKHKFSHLMYDTRIYLCSVSECSVVTEGEDYIWVQLKDVKNFTHNTFCQNIVDFYKRYVQGKTSIFMK